MKILTRIGSLLFATIRTEILEAVQLAQSRIDQIEHQCITIANDATRLARAQQLDAQVVVWGAFLETFDRSVIREHKCFTLELETWHGGYIARFQPQRLFKLQRWLLLGPAELRVKEVIVGNMCHTPPCFVTGVAGRMGDGDFQIADVGTMIQFEIGGIS
jgi:hypothetical protein